MADRGLCTREEIPAEAKWAIEDLYKNDDEWEADFTRLKEHLPELSAYEGRLGESAQTLLSMQRLCDKMNMLAEKVYVYANQRLHENTDNAVYQNLASRAQSLLVEMSERTSYIEPEIMELPEGTIEKYLQENGELRVYGQYFENMIRQKAHVLPGEMEKLLASAGELAESPKDIFSMFNNADIRFPKITGEDGTDVEVTHGRFISLLQSKDQRVRKDAFEALYGVYEKFRNTLAATYRANVKQEVFFARARRYGSDLEGALDGSHIPVSVYDNLIHVVHEHLPLMHRYVKIRKKLLGLDELHMYDLYTPMTENSGEHFSFEDAKKTVLEGLAPMGEEYLSHLKDGFEHGWIDVYENQGKRSGAYSWGAYGCHPFVLMNYQDNLNNVFTLAHEMGHSMHSYYSDKNQPYIYAGYRIFVAEVASTCNEALLMEYLLKNTEEKKEKMYLINYFLEQFKGTLYRQTMFAEFEKITHEMAWNKEPLTAEVLCDIYYKLNQKYFGEDIVIDKEIALEWARIPHFYTPFYVYQYATGYSAAIAISRKILSGDERAKEGYFKFLSGGSSMNPIDLLRLCNVDMAAKEPIESALKLFGELLDEMEEML